VATVFMRISTSWNTLSWTPEHYFQSKSNFGKRSRKPCVGFHASCQVYVTALAVLSAADDPTLHLQHKESQSGLKHAPGSNRNSLPRPYTETSAPTRRYVVAASAPARAGTKDASCGKRSVNFATQAIVSIARRVGSDKHNVPKCGGARQNGERVRTDTSPTHTRSRRKADLGESRDT
jgi:hypothetical protein